jgi:hypothetical protein
MWIDLHPEWSDASENRSSFGPIAINLYRYPVATLAFHRTMLRRDSDSSAYRPSADRVGPRPCLPRWPASGLMSRIASPW